MADSFAAHCILLVLVIQRCSGARVDGATQSDLSGSDGEGAGLVIGSVTSRFTSY